MLKMFAEIIDGDGKVGLVRAFEIDREEVPDGWVDVDAHPEVRRGYLYDGSNFTKQLPPQVGVITIVPSEINLGESATVTITAKTNKYPSGTVRTDFAESVNISAINGQGIELRHRFTFVDGVASKEITPKVEGVYTLGDSGRMDLQLTGDKEIDVLTP